MLLVSHQLQLVLYYLSILKLSKNYLFLDSFKPPERAISKPLRVCISDVYKSSGSGFSIVGRVETGQLRVGDKVLVQPQGEIAQIKSECFH